LSALLKAAACGVILSPHSKTLSLTIGLNSNQNARMSAQDPQHSESIFADDLVGVQE
jgi:hypothetical protein